MGPVLPHQEEEEGCGAGWCWRDFPACSLGWFLPWRWERLLCALCLDQHPKSSSSPAAGKQRQSPCPRLRVGTALSPARAAAAAGGSHISCSFGLFVFSVESGALLLLAGWSSAAAASGAALVFSGSHPGCHSPALQHTGDTQRSWGTPWVSYRLKALKLCTPVSPTQRLNPTTMGGWKPRPGRGCGGSAVLPPRCPWGVDVVQPEQL